MRFVKGFGALMVVAAAALFVPVIHPQQTGGGQGAASGTVSGNSGTAGALARYAAAGGSTTVAASTDVFDNGSGTLTVGAVGVGSGVVSFAGVTSGTKSVGCSNATCTTVTIAANTFVGSGGNSAMAASAFISEGTTFTSNAGCLETSLAGGATIGKFASGTTGTCATTITMGNTATAPNGWVCSVFDQSTAVSGVTTASSATTATISVATTSGNTVIFSCLGY